MDKVEFGFNTPFKEQLDFFRQKLNLPTERWDDIIKSAHDKAFIVAGAANADLLQDLRNAIDKAIAEGKGLEVFRKDFKQIVAKHGWVDYTGAGSAAGVAWRTKVIYQTNMSTSYAAGRYKQLTEPEYLKLRPNWKYVHNDSVMHPRPLHLSWDGTVLPHDHPFWKTHFAPNGWGCQCRIVPARGGEKVTTPPNGWDTLDPKTGAPIGIDKGFDYAFGASQDNLLAMVQKKLITYPEAIAKALTHFLHKKVIADGRVDDFAARAVAQATYKADLFVGFVVESELPSYGGYMVNLTADGIRHIEKVHKFDGDGQRPIIARDYAAIISIVRDYDSVQDNESALTFTQKIGKEVFKVTYEKLTSKKKKELRLKTAVIKT